MASMNTRAKEVIAELDQFEFDMNLTNKWVHGDENLTVLLGGVSTPTIRNLVKNFRLSAQEILDAAEYIQDNYDGLSDIIEANVAYAEIADTLLLKIATWMARDLAEMNRMNIDRYNDWYKHGIEKLHDASMETRQNIQSIRDMMEAFDESYAQHRLQTRLFDGTNPTSSSKPVLFIISGQSNASGGGKYKPFERAVDCGQFWEWCAYSASGVMTHLAPENQSLKPLADPVGEGYYGSGGVPFARKFFQLTGRKVILLNIASSGSIVTDNGTTTTNTWSGTAVNGTLRSSRQAVWDAFSAAVPASSYDLGGILWDQGGSDAARLRSGQISVQDFKDGSHDVWSWTRSLAGDASLPVFVNLIDYNTIPADNASRGAIIEALREMCVNGASQGIYFGGSMAPYYTDAPSEYLSDYVHYSRRGYRIQGESFARSVVSQLNF